MQRALIVGHTGQDGQLLWDQLAARDYSLLGISSGSVRDRGLNWHNTVDIVDAHAVDQLVAAIKPDQIYFLAAHHHSSEQVIDPHEVWVRSWQIHVAAFSNFLWAATRLDCRPRVFYASSSRVFGNASASPQDEATPFRPADTYGVTKAAAMNVADFFRREHGLFVACGILFNHESPLRAAHFVSRRVVDGLVAIKNGQADSLTIGSLGARVDWGYAGDYTRAMQLTLDADLPNDFVIATGKTHSVGELVEAAMRHLGMSKDVLVNETAQLLKREAQELCGNPAKLVQITGWRRKVDFDSLVALLVEGAVMRAASKSR